MKESKILIGVAILVMSGCSIREGYRSYETTEVSNNGGIVEQKLVEEYVGPDKERVVSKQVVREKAQCVGPDGRPISAKSASSCMAKKGKMVNEVYQEEKVIRNK